MKTALSFAMNVAFLSGFERYTRLSAGALNRHLDLGQHHWQIGPSRPQTVVFTLKPKAANLVDMSADPRFSFSAVEFGPPDRRRYG